MHHGPTKFMRVGFLGWLCLGLVLESGASMAQQADPDPASIYKDADHATAEGDLDAARRQIIEILSQQGTPVVLGAGALRLSQIAQLAGNAPAAEQPLQDALKLIPADDKAAQPVLAAIYLQLGALAMAQGDMGRAQLALLKGIAIGKRITNPDDPQLLEAELSLATAEIRSFLLEQATARIAAIEPRLKDSTSRLAAIYQSTLGELNLRQYHYEAALAAQEKAVEIFRLLYGPDHAEVARAETSLGASLFSAGRYLEAERGLQHAVKIYDYHPDFYAPALATALINLGQVYYTTGRLALAVTALDRASGLATKNLGPGSQIEAAAVLHRGFARLRQNDLAAASADIGDAIAIWSDPNTENRRAAAGAGVWLAEAERRAGHGALAAVALDKSGGILSGIFGPDSYAVTDVLIGRAELRIADNTAASAIPDLQRAYEIREKWLGGTHVATLDVRSLLSLALAESGDIPAGLAAADAVTADLRARIALLQAGQSANATEEVAALRRLLGRHIQVIALALRGEIPEKERAALLAQSLALAQLARSSAAGTAIAGLGQRQALSDLDAASDLREVQVAVLRWQMAERGLAASVVAANGSSNLASLQAAVNNLAKKASDLQQEFSASHPDNVSSTTAPVEPASIQGLLLPGEAVLAFLTLEDHSYTWVISPERVALLPLAASDFQLSERIHALRRTVDPKEVQGLSDILPFDVGAASDLYDMLIAPAELPGSISHLIIVPDGTLQSLPFASLLSQKITPPADFVDYRQLPWLIRDRDLTILPEIGAFATLRRSLRPSAATAPFLGIGDPVLNGAPVPVQGDASISDLLRGLAPLPESADELAALALALKAAPESVITGAAATEAALKTWPLDRYRIIAFATHGLMAGDFGRLREPGLVLTPPALASGDDDGFLTVGEISELKLDAELVVLSACNTAAADGSPGAEGLSGLARAFFFAGSRALLVSQWEVLSVAAVQLTTGTFERLAADPALGRAAALRQAMLALLADDQPDYLAHPIFWAPFELVGEGGVPR